MTLERWRRRQGVGPLRLPSCRALAAAVLLIVVSWCPVTAGAGPGLAGRPLADVLAELQRQGLVIVFSSALVRPDMVVTEEPATDDPRAVLDLVLASHGLAVREGPGEQLVVVRAERPPATGTIRGRVRAEGGEPLLGTVTIHVVGSDLATSPEADGRFVIRDVPEGEQTLEVRSRIFLPQRVEGVRVRAEATSRVAFDLVPASAFLDEIVVTPSHFRILGEQPESREFLSRDDVDQMPHVADDLYRAVKRLPGAAGGDISAKFNIRGGEPDEVLVLLDGIELYEPFHLKDFQSVFSTVDAEAVRGVDFLTGGFPVEYGDRMSGVMDITIATPTGPAATSAALGTLNSRLLSEGTFDDERGAWLVSGRGWYPDVLLDLAGATRERIDTDYFDLLAKVEHTIGSRSRVSANVLAAADTVGFETDDEEGFERVSARDRSLHLWLNLRTQWSHVLFSRTVLSGGRIRRDRAGGLADVEDGTLEISDSREFEFLGLRQDWVLELGDRHLLKSGFDLKYQDATYDYVRSSGALDGGGLGEGDATVDLDPDGWSSAVYVADRFRIGPRLVTELGLRWDRQTWHEGGQVSPRANFRWAAGPRTTLRAAWGRFHQSQRLNELQVEDGVSEFYPAQLAEHWLASLEHRVGGVHRVRVEVFHKVLDELRPRYENLFNPMELFPEGRFDRVLVDPEEGRSEGVEVLVTRDGGKRLTWWLSYALSRAEDRIDGEWVPRSWDQRHAASFGLNLSLPRDWNLNLAGTFHTGWPTTGTSAEVVGGEPDDPEVEIVFGPRNRERFPGYRRFDLRVSKVWPTGRGEVTLILEVVNFTNRKNLCCVNDLVVEAGGGTEVRVFREPGYWAPIVPSMSARWRF